MVAATVRIELVRPRSNAPAFAHIEGRFPARINQRIAPRTETIRTGNTRIDTRLLEGLLIKGLESKAAGRVFSERSIEEAVNAIGANPIKLREILTAGEALRETIRIQDAIEKIDIISDEKGLSPEARLAEIGKIAREELIPAASNLKVLDEVITSSGEVLKAITPETLIKTREAQLKALKTINEAATEIAERADITAEAAAEIANIKPVFADIVLSAARLDLAEKGLSEGGDCKIWAGRGTQRAEYEALKALIKNETKKAAGAIAKADNKTAVPVSIAQAPIKGSYNVAKTAGKDDIYASLKRTSDLSDDLLIMVINIKREISEAMVKMLDKMRAEEKELEKLREMRKEENKRLAKLLQGKIELIAKNIRAMLAKLTSLQTDEATVEEEIATVVSMLDSMKADHRSIAVRIELLKN